MNFSYYGLSLDVSGLGLNVYQTQLLFGAVELPSKLLVYLSVRHAGRRLTLAGALLGTALSLGLRLVVSSGESRPLAERAPFPGTSSQNQLRPAFTRGSTSRTGSPWLSHQARPLPEPLFLQRCCPGAPPWRWWVKASLKLPSALPTCSRRSCILPCSGEGSLGPR